MCLLITFTFVLGILKHSTTDVRYVLNSLTTVNRNRAARLYLYLQFFDKYEPFRLKYKAVSFLSSHVMFHKLYNIINNIQYYTIIYNISIQYYVYVIKYTKIYVNIKYVMCKYDVIHHFFNLRLLTMGLQRYFLIYVSNKDIIIIKRY